MADPYADAVWALDQNVYDSDGDALLVAEEFAAKWHVDVYVYENPDEEGTFYLSIQSADQGLTPYHHQRPES